MTDIDPLRQSNLERDDFDREKVKRQARINEDREDSLREAAPLPGGTDFNRVASRSRSDQEKMEKNETPLARFIAEQGGASKTS